MLLVAAVDTTASKPRIRICEKFESAPQSEFSKTILIRGPGSQLTEDALRFKESRQSIEEIAQAIFELGMKFNEAKTLAALKNPVEEIVIAA